MDDSTQNHTLDLDESHLHPIVAQILDAPTVEITDWGAHDLGGGAGSGVGGTALTRVLGRARVGGETKSWSAILKRFTARGAASDDDPGHIHYWRREAEAFCSGWLGRVPGGVVAPPFYGSIHPDDTCVWVWMADIVDRRPGRWTLADFAQAARHLGRFNGAYLAGEPLPDHPWWCRDFVRQDLNLMAATIDDLPGRLADPHVQRQLPGDAAARLQRLWAERETFLQALDGLPQTLCHFDAFRRNIMTGDYGEMVLIDWAAAGPGPVGAELTSLVWVSLLFLEADPARAQALDNAVFPAYLAGLRDAGWPGDAAEARLGFTAAVGLRRLGTLALAIPHAATPAGRDWMATTIGLPNSDDILDQQALAGRFVEGLVDEARGMMGL